MVLGVARSSQGISADVHRKLVVTRENGNDFYQIERQFAMMLEKIGQLCHAKLYSPH